MKTSQIDFSNGADAMMKKRILRCPTCLLTAGLLFLTACGLYTNTTFASPAQNAQDSLSSSDTETILSQMTLSQKVGQLFFVRPDALSNAQKGDGSGVTEMTAQMRRTLEEYPVGGVALFGKNIVSPKQLIRLNQELQAASPIPLFLAVDEEGGAVARLANHEAFDLPKYESAAAVAADGDVSAARDMGKTIGGYLKSYGFNMDFAPDADVNTNPDNPVIGTRSFSRDAAVAAEMAGAMADGLRQEHIIPVFKHFPGHGDTAQDSHNGMAVSEKTKAEMARCEWVPFLKADESACIMIGHISTPNLTGDLLPASLSEQTVTGILRKELGFRGVILTDSLEMGAIAEEYGAKDAAVLAFRAGCDIILMPEDLPEAFHAVLDEVESGRISQERLDDSVRRILRLKKEYGLL